MNAKMAYVCFSCNQIMDRAPRGECSYCGSERIVSVASLMHEPVSVAKRFNLVPVSGAERPHAERL